jgi:hypothetical protein
MKCEEKSGKLQKAKCKFENAKSEEKMVGTAHPTKWISAFAGMTG